MSSGHENQVVETEWNTGMAGSGMAAELTVTAVF